MGRLTKKEYLSQSRKAKRNLILKKASVPGYKRPEGWGESGDEVKVTVETSEIEITEEKESE